MARRNAGGTGAVCGAGPASCACPAAVRGPLICCLLAISAGLAAADNSAPPESAFVDPLTLGLNIPAATVSSGDGRRVVTNDDGDAPVVARVHINVGAHRIVLLPDGQLVARPIAQTPETDRPFEPATREAIARRLLVGRLTGFQTKETVRYLYVYNTSQTFADVTSRILETMFKGVVAHVQAQKIEVRAPETPLVVIMFRTEAEYQQHRRVPEGTGAYYDVLTNRIVMYEESPLWRIKPELAVQQALCTIAHEGAHQILHNIGVQQRLSVWPMWLSEGLAEFFAPTTMDRHMKWKGAGQVNDLRMFELEQYLKSRSADETSGQLVAQTVGAERLTSTGYAAAWGLTNYLAKAQRPAFHALVREASRLRPLEGPRRVVPPGVVPDNVRVFKQHFGDDLAEIERRLILHLKNLPYTDPFAEWPHYVALVEAAAPGRPRRQANVFHTPEQAEKWRQEMLSQVPEPQRAAAQTVVREFPNRLLAEQFARQWLRGR
jgi:hypothetical protein